MKREPYKHELVVLWSDNMYSSRHYVRLKIKEYILVYTTDFTLH
jgi:hypothetical protein